MCNICLQARRTSSSETHTHPNQKQNKIPNQNKKVKHTKLHQSLAFCLGSHFIVFFLGPKINDKTHSCSRRRKRILKGTPLIQSFWVWSLNLRNVFSTQEKLEQNSRRVIVTSLLLVLKTSTSCYMHSTGLVAMTRASFRPFRIWLSVVHYLYFILGFGKRFVRRETHPPCAGPR